MKHNKAHTNVKRVAHVGLIVILALGITNCSTFPRSPFTERMEYPKADKKRSEDIVTGGVSGRSALNSEPGLTPPTGRSSAAPIISSQPPSLTGPEISINFEGINLPSFVNTVFGELLNVTFEIDSAVTNRDQLVT